MLQYLTMYHHRFVKKNTDLSVDIFYKIYQKISNSTFQV